jgi:soluble lytic murein transglycosylase
LFVEVADLRDYYGYLAADRLHRGYDLHARPSPDDGKLQASMAAEPGMIRAHELFDCDMADDAAAEWTAALGSADAAVKIQAAHLASRWGWYAESITVLAQAGEWDDVRLRYPRPYADAVAEAAKLADVPADWILGVMRQESLFRKDAVSRADARGLMQMLPVTAAAVARRWHLPPPRKDALFDPSVAVPLGAAYLHELLDRRAGQIVLALAAYNAGPSPLIRWLPLKPMDADVWIENIPYGETRAYVQHILEHIVAFAFVRGAEPPRLEALLPVVEPGV